MSLKRVAFNRDVDDARPFEKEAYDAILPVLKSYYPEEAIESARISTQMLRADGSHDDIHSYSVLILIEAAPGEQIAEIALNDGEGYYYYGGYIPANGH